MAEALDPLEVCEVCGDIREEHGDKNHEFSQDGIIVPIKKGEPARQSPPRAKDDQLGVEVDRISRDPVTAMSLRMIERLVAKNLLDGEDLMFIFGNKS